MAIFPKIIEKIRPLIKPAIIIYPLVVIIAIPLLLALNTIWNLRTFNRDVNFIIRHQAISIADTLKPVITQNLENPAELYHLLQAVTQSNADIVSVTLLKQKGNSLEALATTSPQEASSAAELGLNQLAIGFDQPFAGLSYDPNLGKNVWNVVVPLSIEDSSEIHLLSVKLKTEIVDEILGRTSKDSFIILSILIVITLILLTNHFVFYRKALKTQQLEELDRLKDEFISMAAHELRAPITGLVGYLSLLKDKVPIEAKEILGPEIQTLNRLTLDLRNLINDLLDVSRIEQGRLKIVLAETQINDVIGNTIKTLTPTAEKKGVTIKFTPTTLPTVKTDPDRLRQVLTNLVSNSIKYTLKGEINITAITKAKFIELSVKDSGIGIQPDELPKLFSKFHRVKDKKTEDVRGTGLGLWITKEIVENLGGKIHAESIYGTGSVFTFTIPLSGK